MTDKDQQSKRTLDGLLTPLESRAIRYLVPRLPAWTTPDQLTYLGLVGAAITALGYGLSNLHPGYLFLASAGLAIHWFGDSLDGNLARLRKRERPRYGFFFDQTMDVIGNLLIGGGIGLSPYVRMDVALFVLTGFNMVSIYTYVKNAVAREFDVTVGFMGPTEIRAILVLLNLALYVIGAEKFTLLGVMLTWCDLLMIAGGCAFVAIFLIVTLSYAAILRIEAPGPQNTDGVN